MTAPISPHIIPQHDGCCRSAGIVELGKRTQVQLTGEDRNRFLHNLCTNDIQSLGPGQACEAFFTNVQGKTVGHGHVLCNEDSLVVDTVAGQADKLINHLDRYLIREDVVLTDQTDEWDHWLVAGPDSRKLLAGLVQSELPPLMGHANHQVATHVVSLRCLGYAGEQSVLLACHVGHATEVVEAVVDAGARRCDRELAEILRVEAGTPAYEFDITDRNLPQELSRDEKAISFTKGCYLGQETVARIDALGHVNRYLVALRLDGPAAPPAGSKISFDDKEIGEVTSAVYSPRLSTGLALAFARREHSAVGTRVATAAGPAEIIELPTPF